jgi:hypothetical protein
MNEEEAIARIKHNEEEITKSFKKYTRYATISKVLFILPFIVMGVVMLLIILNALGIISRYAYLIILFLVIGVDTVGILIFRIVNKKKAHYEVQTWDRISDLYKDIADCHEYSDELIKNMGNIIDIENKF